jgi:uncharacterized protein (UPF0332 family)
MTLHDDLLATAKYLTRRNNNKPTEADLRRSVSTAYYALFHRLIQAAINRLLPGADQQAVLARMFEHGRMKGLCQKVVELEQLGQKPAGKQRPAWADAFLTLLGTAPKELLQVAEAFVAAQDARHTADYDRAAAIDRKGAGDLVSRVEKAFTHLAAVETTPAGQAFLLLLLVGEPKTR